MKRLLLATALMLVAGSGLAAEPRAPEVREDVRRLMQIMQADQIFAQIRGQMGQMMTQSAEVAAGNRLDEAQRQILTKYLDRMAQVMFSEQSVDRLMTATASIYSQQFSEEEVRDMIRFYESETGRAMVRKMPQVMQQSMTLSMDWIQALKPELDRISQEMAAELQQAAEGKK